MAVKRAKFGKRALVTIATRQPDCQCGWISDMNKFVGDGIPRQILSSRVYGDVERIYTLSGVDGAKRYSWPESALAKYIEPEPNEAIPWI